MQSGRVNQKRRTRAAIVEAARALLADGVSPTVALAGEKALVSRTTAYRYFPTQESLLVEVAVTADVDEIEALAAEPLGAADVEARLLALLGSLTRHVLADEVRYRTLLRVYLDQWLTATAEGEDAPVVREGRRLRWIETTVEPLRGLVPDDRLRLLGAALSMVTGIEAVIALRDTARLDPDEAATVADWATRALLRAALAEDG